MRLHPLYALAAFLLFSTASVAQESDSVNVKYYPGNNNRIAIGSEEFLKNYSSLAGIVGAYVLLDYVEGSSKKNGISIKSDLKEQIIARFDAVGLKFLTKEEMEVSPGKPELSIFPSYTGGSIGRSTSSAVDNGVAAASGSCSFNSDTSCCRNSVWMSFSQSASILRRPDSQFKLGTWGTGDDSNWCENRGEWMYDAVLNVIDAFIDDYKRAEAEREPIKVSSEGEVPVNCAQAWALHMQIFDTDATQPNATFIPILNKLALQARRCSNYSYLIETHADSRSNERYNKLLTEARAAAIKENLLASGIQYNRLKTLAHGESKPLTTGSTEADHAANRRVVITPVLIDSFLASTD